MKSGAEDIGGGGSVVTDGAGLPSIRLWDCCAFS